MNIFLTSQASNVLRKISSLLPKKPNEYKAIFIPTAAKPYDDASWMYTDKNELTDLGFRKNGVSHHFHDSFTICHVYPE